MWYVRKHLICYQGVTRFCQHFMNLIFNNIFSAVTSVSAVCGFLKTSIDLRCMKQTPFYFECYILNDSSMVIKNDWCFCVIQYGVSPMCHPDELLLSYWNNINDSKEYFRWSFKNTVSHKKFTIMFMYFGHKICFNFSKSTWMILLTDIDFTSIFSVMDSKFKTI